MAIPLSYNLRNLVVRRTTTVMTALGIALTVAVLLAVLALVNGLRTAFRVSAHPLHVLVLRKGATAELSSAMTRQQFQDVKLRAGIARGARGEPLASLELVTILNLPSRESPDGMNVTLRGLLPAGVALRSNVALTAGRMFDSGKREVVVGKSVAARYPDAAIGGTLRFGGGTWEIVGVIDGGRSAVNSEIFGDLNQVSAAYNRANGLSSILLRADDDAAAEALARSLEGDRRLNVKTIRETAYFESQMVTAAPVEFLGVLVAMIMAVGSCFAAMNTMYASVARRAREIGTLRVLGFSRASVMTSFLIESLLLAGLGGILGCLLVLPLDGITTGLGSFVTFSEISFDYEVSPRVMATGIGFALVVGAMGGLFPAAGAARKQILTALRER